MTESTDKQGSAEKLARSNAADTPKKELYLDFPNLVGCVQEQLLNINPVLIAKADFYNGDNNGDAQRVVLVDTGAVDEAQVLVGYTEDELRRLIAQQKSLVPLESYWQEKKEAKVGDEVLCQLVGTPYSLSRGHKLKKIPRSEQFGFVVESSGEYVLTRICKVKHYCREGREYIYYWERENVKPIDKVQLILG